MAQIPDQPVPSQLTVRYKAHGPGRKTPYPTYGIIHREVTDAMDRSRIDSQQMSAVPSEMRSIEEEEPCRHGRGVKSDKDPMPTGCPARRTVLPQVRGGGAGYGDSAHQIGLSGRIAELT